MFPQYGDVRYPPNFGPGHGQVHMDPTAGAGRYAYPGGYISKGPEGGQYGGMNVPLRAAQQYGGKPGAMASQEGMYGHNWGPGAPNQPFMNPMASKPVLGAAYPGQVSYWQGRVTFFFFWSVIQVTVATLCNI